jgi:hypothetical protein
MNSYVKHSYKYFSLILLSFALISACTQKTSVSDNAVTPTGESSSSSSDETCSRDECSSSSSSNSIGPASSSSSEDDSSSSASSEDESSSSSESSESSESSSLPEITNCSGGTKAVIVHASGRSNMDPTEHNIILGLFAKGLDSHRLAFRGLGKSTGSIPYSYSYLMDPFSALHLSYDPQAYTNDNYGSGYGLIPETMLPASLRSGLDVLETGFVHEVSGMLDGEEEAFRSATYEVHAKPGQSGVALAETYDLSTENCGLANASIRGYVPVGGQVVFGFMLSPGSTSNKSFVIRAYGQTATGSDVLSNPMFKIYDSEGTLVRTAKNWRDGMGRLDNDEKDKILEVFGEDGFVSETPERLKDAVAFVTAGPRNNRSAPLSDTVYTVVVESQTEGGSGAVQVELYDISED